MARQARFGGAIDHGHEAAIHRNENKTLTLLWHVTCVAKETPGFNLRRMGPFNCATASF
jgi:hypothetical protein